MILKARKWIEITYMCRLLWCMEIPHVCRLRCLEIPHVYRLWHVVIPYVCRQRCMEIPHVFRLQCMEFPMCAGCFGAWRFPMCADCYGNQGPGGSNPSWDQTVFLDLVGAKLVYWRQVGGRFQGLWMAH